MPWREETSPMDQRTQSCANTTPLSKDRLQVDRAPTFAKGPAGLEERSRRPRRSLNQTAEETIPAGRGSARPDVQR